MVQDIVPSKTKFHVMRSIAVFVCFFFLFLGLAQRIHGGSLKTGYTWGL